MTDTSSKTEIIFFCGLYCSKAAWITNSYPMWLRLGLI